MKTSDKRLIEMYGTFARLAQKIEENRQLADVLFAQEDRHLDYLTAPEKEEVKELSTWEDRKGLYVGIKRMQRLQDRIIRKLFLLEAGFSSLVKGDRHLIVEEQIIEGLLEEAHRARMMEAA